MSISISKYLIIFSDEHLSKTQREKLFQNALGGVFSDQMICKECPHRYEREQIFLALNLPVKSHNLVDSLEQFVKGELLEGDNAYYCEECGVKVMRFSLLFSYQFLILIIFKQRNTMKRMCIKTLPSTLVIQLKRFYYDWDAARSLKFDDYFQVSFATNNLSFFVYFRHHRSCFIFVVSMGFGYGTVHCRRDSGSWKKR